MADLLATLNNPQPSEMGTALQFPSHLALSTEAKSTFQQGMAKLQMAQPAEAVELFTRTVELAPYFPEARICLGLAYALTYNIYSAIDSLEVAGEMDPENFAAHYTLAQLNFKLRIPQKGYEAAQKALKSISTLEQRKMLTALLKEERAREHNGIARPWFNQPFSKFEKILWGGGLALAVIALLTHVRW